MRKEAFFTQLARELEELWSDYDGVNYGGCGAFALAGHDALAKIGIKANIWYVGYDYPDYNPRSARSRAEFVREAHFKHFVLETAGTFFDCEGILGGFAVASDMLRIKYNGSTSMIRVSRSMLVEFMSSRRWNSHFGARLRKSLAAAVRKRFKKISPA